MSVAERTLRTARATEPWTLVSCEECGRTFHLKPRAVRALIAGDRSARCDRCIFGLPLVVTDEERRFWLERFTVGELVEIATACWGSPAAWDDSWRAGFTFTIPGEVAA